MIVNLTGQPEVEILKAQELDTDKLYLLVIPRETPSRLSQELAHYLKALGVQAVVLALGDVNLYAIERTAIADVLDAEIMEPMEPGIV